MSLILCSHPLQLLTVDFFLCDHQTPRTMIDTLQSLSDSLSSRWAGAMSFRLIIQPIVASFLAIRAGFTDASEGRQAFLWAAVSDSAYRAEFLHGAWKDVRPVFVIAFVLDSIYQIIASHRVHVFEALIFATLLAVLPYLLLRGPVCRIMKAVPRREAKVNSPIQKN